MRGIGLKGTVGIFAPRRARWEVLLMRMETRRKWGMFMLILLTNSCHCAVNSLQICSGLEFTGAEEGVDNSSERDVCKYIGLGFGH
jgi:hypothetical protein